MIRGGATALWAVLRRAEVCLFLGVVITVLAVTWIPNHDVFSTPFHEGGDTAADSLLVERAVHLQQLVGHYSRAGFYHPGPGLLYILAAGQVLFFDVLHVAAAPYNGQLMGVTVFFAVIAGLCVLAIYRATRSWPAASVSAAILLWYAAHNNLLLNAWPPYLFPTAFVLFVVTGAALLAGRTSEVGSFVIGAGLLLHAHISFVMFVLVTSAVVIWRWRRLYPAERRQEQWQAHRLSRRIAIIAAGVFTLPVALDFVLHFPGQWPAYVTYVTSGHKQSRTPGDIWRFTWQYWSSGHIPATVLFGAAVVALALFVREPDLRLRRFIGALYAMIALQTLLFGIYAAQGIDALTPQNQYVGLFYQSVPAVFLVSVATHLCVRVTRLRRAAALSPVTAGWSTMRRAGATTFPVAVTALSLLAALHVARSSATTSIYRGERAYAAATNALQRDPARQHKLVALDLSGSPNGFLVGGGIAIQAERSGLDWCVVGQQWRLQFTADRICTAPSADWRVRVLPAATRPPLGMSVVYRWADGQVITES